MLKGSNTSSEVPEHEPQLLTLHGRLPRITGSGAEHGGQVGTAGAWTIAGWPLRAGAKAVAATARGAVAVPGGVRGWLDPATHASWLVPRGTDLP